MNKPTRLIIQSTTQQTYSSNQTTKTNHHNKNITWHNQPINSQSTKTITKPNFQKQSLLNQDLKQTMKTIIQKHYPPNISQEPLNSIFPFHHFKHNLNIS